MPHLWEPPVKSMTLFTSLPVSMYTHPDISLKLTQYNSTEDLCTHTYLQGLCNKIRAHLSCNKPTVFKKLHVHCSLHYQLLNSLYSFMKQSSSILSKGRGRTRQYLCCIHTLPESLTGYSNHRIQRGEATAIHARRTVMQKKLQKCLLNVTCILKISLFFDAASWVLGCFIGVFFGCVGVLILLPAPEYSSLSNTWEVDGRG